MRPRSDDGADQLVCSKPAPGRFCTGEILPMCLDRTQASANSSGLVVGEADLLRQCRQSWSGVGRGNRPERGEVADCAINLEAMFQSGSDQT